MSTDNTVPISALTNNSLSNWAGSSSSYGFPSPWHDNAALEFPTSITHVLRWSEFIFNSGDGIYRQAISRVLSYFNTEVDIKGDIGEEEKKKYQEFSDKTLDMRSAIRTVGLDYMCYGNAFISILMPFKRYMACPKCHNQHPFSTVTDTNDFKFKWSGFELHAYCPRCQYNGDWGKPIDRRGIQDDVRIKRWNPHEIEILWDPYTDDTRILWKIPNDYIKLVTDGRPFILERAPWEVIQSIKKKEYFKFAKDVIYHLKDDALAGIYNRGWGIPQSMTNFRQVYYVQVLRRQNEAIGLDYVVPFRVLTPAPQGGADPAAKDPLLNMNLGGFVGRMQSMLRRRRRDPAAWNVLPFPIQYQALGGDAKNFAPKDLLDQGQDTLLNQIGVPVDLYKGSLQIGTAPVAVRMFESQWAHLTHALNKFLRFTYKRLSELLSWEEIEAKMVRPKMADDLERRMVQMQLAQIGKVSDTTALQAFGMDKREELKRTYQDQLLEQEIQKEMQDKVDKEQAGAQLFLPPQSGQPVGQDPSQQQGGQGQPQQGGQPGQPQPAQSALSGMQTPPGAKISPQDLLAKAQAMAGQLLTMPDSQRTSELLSLKSANPTLHALVRSSLDSQRSQARSQGGQMLLQQMQGQKGQ